MKGSKLGAVSIIIVCIVLLAGILIAPRALKGPKPDPLGCGPSIPGKTVVLLDQTEGVSRQTKDEILARARRFIEEKVEIGELVSVFYITELSRKNLTPTFSYCKPKNIANPLTESEKLVIKTYKDKFIEPFVAAIAAKAPESKESPITQALVDLSLLEQLRSEKPAKLVVFSDLMEHTGRFSLYKCTSPKSAVAAYRDVRGASVARPSFKNLNVELHVIPRQAVSKATGECRDGFWAWFFGDNEGGNASLQRQNLPGGS